ncbi:MAG: thioredoxin domain-containing protein, partial [Alphaproteobacteria bacterium]|nr:thioredoxin domain-containing protein [Alphaproteobacteria bacterium]
MNQAIEDYLMNNPLKVREALVLAEQQEQIEAQKRIAESYKANIKELNNADNSPFVGPKNAKVTIVEFFDFNCGYCKRLAPEMMKVIKANPDVKFVFKPVTFLGSLPTAKAAMAAYKQGKFLEVYEALLTHNGQITPAVIDEV